MVTGLKFTKLEWDIIIHRLEVPDSIYEALEDHSYEDVSTICELLISKKIKEAFDYNFEIAKEVLIDALEGSTYYACSCDLSHQKRHAIYQAGSNALNKLGKLFGVDVEYPCY